MSAPPAVSTDTIRRPSVDGSRDHVWLLVTAVATALAGLLHLVAAAGHTDAGDLVVGFFLLATAAQGCVAAWLITVWLRPRPSAGPLVAAIAGTVALLLLYLLAHSTTVLIDLGLVPAEHAVGDPASVAHGHAGTPLGHAVVPDGPVAMGGEVPARPAPVDPLGTATVVAENVALAGLIALLSRTWRTRILNGVAALGALVWVSWLAGVLA